MAEFTSFENSLEDDDYGVIIGRNGVLKGIWIPSIVEDNEEIPQAIVLLVKTALGIDLNDRSNYPTIH